MRLQQHGVSDPQLPRRVEYASRDVLSSEELRNGIKEFTSWPTIPQVFIDGEFLGGCDILRQMHQDGELEKALKANAK